MLGSMSTNFEFFKEELNAGVGWSQGQIKVGVNVIALIYVHFDFPILIFLFLRLFRPPP